MVSRILLVQEERADAEVIRDALANSQDQIFRVKWVQHCHAAIEQLAPVGIRSQAAKQGADAILLDLFLSDSQGTATFDRLFAVAAHIPILILTTPEQEDSAKLAVARGAHDYVFKDRLDAYLLPKVLRSTDGLGGQYGSLVPGEGARASNAQFDRRCRHEHGPQRTHHLSQCCCGALDGLASQRG